LSLQGKIKVINRLRDGFEGKLNNDRIADTDRQVLRNFGEMVGGK